MNSTNSVVPELILASSSPWRRELLQRLQIEFRCHSPDIDESLHVDESVEQATARLARQKAQAVQALFPEACILASDQLCSLNDEVLGKPLTRPRAHDQLARLSGQTARFFTAVCVLHGTQIRAAMDITEVRFRTLDDATILRYLDREDALQCAGSFKCEGLGISLFEAIVNRDPTALVGLPMIQTSRLLREVGFGLP